MEELRKAARKLVGSKQVLRGIRNGEVSRVYVANDADTFLYQQIVRAAEAAGLPAVRVASMKELGDACGVDVKTAAAALVRP